MTDAPRLDAARSSARAAAGTAVLAVASTAESFAAAARSGLRPRRRLRRPAAARRGHLDPGHADRAPRPVGRPEVEVTWEVAQRPAVPRRRPPRHVRHRPEPRPHRQGRRHRAVAGDLVPLPLPLRRRHQPGRPHPHRARARTPSPTTCASASSPAPTSRPAGSAPTADWPRATTCTRSSTSATTSTSTRPASTATASTTGTSARHVPAHEMVVAGRLPAAARAVQDRPRPPGACTRCTRGSSPGTTTRSPTTSGGTAPRTTTPGEGDYSLRRARAHRAYDEWMPVRLDGTARLRDGNRLFRRLRFGTARRDQHARPAQLPRPQVAAPPRAGARPDGAVSDPDRTITGRQQMTGSRTPSPAAGRSGRSSATP